MSKGLMIAARAWSVACAVLAVLYGVLIASPDLRLAIAWIVLGCIPWALLWIIRGTLRR